MNRVEERVDGWRERRFSGGYDGLRDLEDEEFSGLVESEYGTRLSVVNGRIVGVHAGTIEDFERAEGVAREAPSPALPLLHAMEAEGGSLEDRYYTKDTPISVADQTLSSGSFTGYVELSENVISGDYYVLYHAGKSMSVAFLGSSGRVVTGDEAFEKADDEVGIYEVNSVDLDVIEVPDPDPAPTGETEGAAGGAGTNGANDPDTAPGTANESDTATGSSTNGATGSDPVPGTNAADPDRSRGSGPGETDDPGSARTGGDDPAPGHDEDDGPAPGRGDHPAGEGIAEANGGASERDPAGAGSGDPLEPGSTGDGRDPPSGDPEAENRTNDGDASDRHGTGTATDRESPPREGEDTRHAGTDPATGTGSSGREESAGDSTSRESGAGPSDRGEQSGDRRDPAGGTGDRSGTGNGTRDDARSPSGDRSSGGRQDRESRPGRRNRRSTTPDERDPDGKRRDERGDRDSPGDPEAADRREGRPRESGTESRSGTGTGAGTGESDRRDSQERDPGGDRSGRRDARSAGETPEEENEVPAEYDDIEFSPGDDPFREEAAWRESESVPSIDPERSDQVVEDLRERVARQEETIRRLQDRMADLEADDETRDREHDRIRSEVEEVAENLGDLRRTVLRLDEAVERIESSGTGGGGEATSERPDETRNPTADPTPATEQGVDLGVNEALADTTVLVQYGSQSEPTLETARGGGASPTEVNENLGLDLHTPFDEAAATVEGEPYREFLTGRIEYRFFEWILRELPYEIRDTGNRSALADLYDAIPEIDRAEFRGSIATGDDEDDVRFDVLARDGRDRPLVGANFNVSRDPATKGMVVKLRDRANAALQTEGLSAAFLVTESYFEGDARDTAEAATEGSFLSRSSKKSYVNVARKQGYHLCLVAVGSDGDFHLKVPEL